MNYPEACRTDVASPLLRPLRLSLYATCMTLQLTPRLSLKPIRFPNRIREYRLRLGLSQEALGALIRKNRKVISAWERGQQFPAGPVLLRLAKVLNTLAESLYEGFYSPPPLDEPREETQP